MESCNYCIKGFDHEIFCLGAPKPAKRPVAEVKAKKEPEEPVKKVEPVPAPVPAPTPAPLPTPAQLIQAEYQQLVLVSLVSLLRPLIHYCSD